MENLTQEIFFIDHAKPDLPAGKYKATANVLINFPVASRALSAKTENNETHFIAGEKVFFVDAPRFSIPNHDIYATYPADNQVSDFKDTIPHIVFKRRTLPWEREFVKTVDGYDAPWMCLLLISEDNEKYISRLAEPISKINTNATVLYPSIELQPWEIENDKEKTVDLLEVQSSYLADILPATDMLGYLAHVRKVEITNDKEKASLNEVVEENAKHYAYFSTLVCGSCIPEVRQGEQKKFTAFLVSLENYGNLFTGAPIAKPVRFFILHSWSFYTKGGQDFIKLCKNIKVQTYNIHYTRGDKAEEIKIKDIFEYGHIPLKHHARNGSSFISLYRGPLSPNVIPNNATPEIYQNADSALRYDHEIQLFDVSYAAAWQLGRLLALKDKELAKHLYKWQRQYVALELQKIKYREMAGVLAIDINNQVAMDEGAFNLERFLIDFLTSENRKTATEQFQGHYQKIASLEPEIPTTIQTKLKDLALLKSVPLNYLIPDERLIPADTLAVFQPDTTWIDYLLNGALSIALNEDTQSVLSNLRESFSNSQTNGLYGMLSGFMLRSPLINGWSGVNISAKGFSGEILTPVRIEIVKSDILLCFFDAKIKSVSITQPLESLFFTLRGTSFSNNKKLTSAMLVGPPQLTGPAAFANKFICKPIEYIFELKYL